MKEKIKELLNGRIYLDGGMGSALLERGISSLHGETLNIEKPETINEVGSIYTVQGFDLNYVGVILGPPFDYDPSTQRMTVNTDRVTDPEVFKRRDDLTNPQEIQQIKEQLTLNVLNVLMKRGVYGLYIYASQPALRQRLLELTSSK